MMVLGDILYTCLMAFFTVGGMVGLFYFEFSKHFAKTPGIANFIWIGRIVFISSFAISWVILATLFITLPKNHWLDTFLAPPLFLIAWLSLWQLIRVSSGQVGHRQSNNKIIWLFVALMGSVMSLICIQFLLRFSNPF